MTDIENNRKSLFYDKYHKLLLLIPLALLLTSLIYIMSFYSQNHDIMLKDVSLSGGTSLTIYSENLSLKELQSFLKPKFEDVVIRSLTDLKSGKTIALSVESSASPDDLKASLESFLGYKLDDSNSTTEFTGESLGKSFYRELLRAIIIAFIFMSAVIFILFRSFLPSSYVILSAFSDIVIPLAIIDFAGLRISTAGIAAFLMLVGYSVDTDILLTTRVLKRKGEDTLNNRIFGAMKTGMTMTLTSLLAVLFAYFIVISPVLKQVFLILSIGLFIDLIITWLLNASLLKWYCEKRGLN